MHVRTVVKMLGQGSLRDRLSAVRAGRAGTRLALVGAALETGVLDTLDAGPRSTGAICEALGLTDASLTEAYLRVLVAAGQVRERAGAWTLTARGRATVRDDVVRATYEAFSDYHTGLYRDLGKQLRGGPGRRDIADKGELIARLSRVMEPFVTSVVGGLAAERHVTRVLDIGCGAGTHLAAMLEAAPAATGLGVDVDPAAAELARATLTARGLADRAGVEVGDVRDVLQAGSVAEPFDLVLLANAIYYVPLRERDALLRTLSELLSPRGALVVVSTALTDEEFSRHFDLLLRAQGEGMELPDLDALAEQLREAGLVPGRPRRIAPGEPLTALVAERPSS
jgi:SAM-dependent methyltransferase